MTITMQLQLFSWITVICCEAQCTECSQIQIQKIQRKKNYAVHSEVLSAVKYKWFNPQVAFLQRPPSRNLNKIKENKRQRGSSK